MHEITHLPYQPWCSTCVASRGRDDQHRKRVPGPERDPTGAEAAKVYFDFGFFRARLSAPSGPFLVGVCRATGFKIALVVKDRLARNLSTINAILNGLRQMGHHGTLILRSDGDSTLLELV